MWRGEGERRKEEGNGGNRRSPLDMVDQEHMSEWNGPWGQVDGAELAWERNSKHLGSTAGEVANRKIHLGQFPQ